jgi:sulfite oxidase
MSRVDAGKNAGMLVHEQEPYNAEPPLSALSSLVTPTEFFYSRNHGPIPTIDPGRWLLEVDGLVERPTRYLLRDLQQLPAVQATVTLQCAGNRRSGLIAVRDVPGEDPWKDGAISTATWTGARLADLLRAVGAQECDGLHVAFEGQDVSGLADPPQPFGGSIPLAKARAEDVLLAWAMNGEPLPALHGGPVRLIVPGYIGARSVKWMQRVRVQDHPSTNWFQAHAYRVLPADAEPAAASAGDGISLGSFAVTSSITDPADGAAVTWPLTIRGYAVAGDGRTVARLDVSVDGGRSWHQARFDNAATPGVWRLWHLTLERQKYFGGDVEVVARAWDDTVAVQPDDPADLWNPKGYANNARPRIRLIGAAGPP